MFRPPPQHLMHCIFPAILVASRGMRRVLDAAADASLMMHNVVFTSAPTSLSAPHHTTRQLYGQLRWIEHFTTPYMGLAALLVGMGAVKFCLSALLYVVPIW